MASSNFFKNKIQLLLQMTQQKLDLQYLINIKAKIKQINNLYLNYSTKLCLKSIKDAQYIMIEQKQNTSEKMSNQNNNLFEKYLQLKNQLILKQFQQSFLEDYQKIQKELQKIIKQGYQSFLHNWNNKEQYSLFKIDNRLACLYSNNQSKQFTSQFICCNKGCLKRAVICNNQKCQCLDQDHKNCLIIPIQTIIKNIQSKVRKPPSQVFYAYIQGKKVLLNFILNIISKQSQIAQEWQNTFLCLNHQISKEEFSPNQYYLYAYNGKIKNCTKIIVSGHQKNSQSHEQNELVQFKDKEQRESKYGHLIKMINQTHNIIIDSILKEIEKVQLTQIRSQHLNYAQYQILKQFMESNGSIDCGTNLEKITGNLVFIAIHLPLKEYTKNTQELSQIEKQKSSQQAHLKMGFDENLIVFIQQSSQQLRRDKNTILDVKNKWNQILSKIFYRQIEGVVFQFDQLLKERIDKPLFFNHENLPNLVQSKLQQIFLELQGKQIYKGKKYQSIQVSPNFISKDIMKTFSKIRLQTNLKKIQKNLCKEISLKLSQDILQKLNSNQLKHLSLHLYEINKFPEGFIKNLCKKFPQIEQFYHYFLSNNEYLQKYEEDRRFLNIMSQKYQLSIQQCIQLSNLKYLQNIFISQIHDIRSADIIKNMNKQQKLKHISLYNDDYSCKRICKQLFQELLEIKSQLVTFSLFYFQINQDDMKNIMKIIQNNQNIQTLVLYNLKDSDKYIKSQLFQCIGRNLKNLKKLIIENWYNNYNKIQQKDFQMLDQCSLSLKLLNLSYFKKIDKQIFKKTIHKMKNITHLILIQDDFVNDDVMQTIGLSLQKLEILSLVKINNITGAGLLKLQNLKYLNMLIFWENTKIKGKDMIQLSKKVKTIKKLQLSWMITAKNKQNFTLQDLISIDTNLNQGITHLTIRCCYKVDLNCIKSLRSLKILSITKDHFKNKEKQELQRYAKQKKITLYQN